MSDRIGAWRVIFIGYVVLLVGYIVVGVASSVPMLVFGFLVLGLFPALTDGVQSSLAAQLSSESSRGSAQGWLNAASGFGTLFAGIIGGFLWQTQGPAYAFAAAACIIVCGLVLLVAKRK